MMGILQEEEKLMEIVQLVGSDSLPDKQQLTLEVARMIREFLLQQNAFHEIDTYCTLDKSYLIMKTVLHFNTLAKAALEHLLAGREFRWEPTKENFFSPQARACALMDGKIVGELDDWPASWRR